MSHHLERITNVLMKYQLAKLRVSRTLENSTSFIEKKLKRLESAKVVKMDLIQIGRQLLFRINKTANVLDKFIQKQKKIETDLFLFVKKNETQLSATHVRQHVSGLLGEIKQVTAYLNRVILDQIPIFVQPTSWEVVPRR